MDSTKIRPLFLIPSFLFPKAVLMNADQEIIESRSQKAQASQQAFES